jgi:Gly-Xaa carboxypeptidase
MAILKLSLLAGAATASVLNIPSSSTGALQQQPIWSSGSKSSSSSSGGSSFQCDLPPALDPAGDGLPAASELFSSDKALQTQVERHQAIVRVPSICFDDLGEIDEDPRYGTFFELHDVLAETYPEM